MLSFTPVILTGTSYLLLNEVPSLFGFAGICIIVSGSYVLNISAEDEHFLDPVQINAAEPGKLVYAYRCVPVCGVDQF